MGDAGHSPTRNGFPNTSLGFGVVPPPAGGQTVQAVVSNGGGRLNRGFKDKDMAMDVLIVEDDDAMAGALAAGVATAGLKATRVSRGS